jgi:HK97 family phage major capsid protein
MSTATQTADEIRQFLLEAGDKLRELREKSGDQRGDTWASDVRQATQEIYSLDALLKIAEAGERASQPKGPEAATLNVGIAELRSPGAVYVESEPYKERGTRYAGGNLPDVKVGMLDHRMANYLHEYRALIQEGGTDSGGLWLPKGQPLPPLVRQMRLFIRDLVSVQDTGLSSVPYLRELNALANEAGATAVAEGAAKPEAMMVFETADAPIRKIAAWVPVTTEVVADAPTLRGYIDTRLAYMLALREEAQVLNGNGTAPNLRGIRQTTGMQTQAAVAGDFSATLGRGIGKIELVDGEADGIAMNPTDFWTMLTTRFATQYDGGFGGGLPFGAPVQGIWGLRVVRTRQMEAGKALIGGFRMGATIFDRQETVIRVGDQHSDYFTSNKLVILAEERIGLAVWRPDFFVEATLA